MKQTADKYGFASVNNITLYFDEYLGREQEGKKTPDTIITIMH
jgi:hypothetical protein